MVVEGSLVGGEGSRDPDRIASGPDLWPVWPQEKGKWRADGGGQGEGKRKRVAAGQGLGFYLF